MIALSKPRTMGMRMVFGIPDKVMPIANRPKGRVRYRFRRQSVARAFFRDENSTRGFIISEPVRGGPWVLIEEARNWRDTFKRQ